jgi:hypothetical protein
LAEHYQFDQERQLEEESAIEVICRFDYYKYCVPIQFAYENRGN